VRLAGDQVEGAGGRRAERRAERVVAHGEVLCVVPERGHGVAVVVAHHLATGLAARAVAATDLLDELVHQAVVEGQLLVLVVVVLISGLELRAVEAEGLNGVRVVRSEQAVVQAVHGRRVFRRRESRLVQRVRRVRIGGEVMVERDVLLKDHDEVLDRRRSGISRLLGV
jgi:hypothetical protein